MDLKHSYIPLTQDTEEEMLKSIGEKSINDLFRDIPSKFRLQERLDLPPPHGELAVLRRIQELAEKNRPMDNGTAFLGSGVEPHYIPATVSSLAGRSEFVTSYTSYQPEISQGMLQSLFEYQSLLAELLEIDVVNSSMYDMASSLAEAVLMASRVSKKRSKFLLPRAVNPRYLDVVRTYAEPADIEVVQVDYDTSTGRIDISDLESKLDREVAGVYIQNPNYFGVLEGGLNEIDELVHGAGALLVAGVDILSLGLLKPPGDYGADIVVAEGHTLGTPMSYGGPLLGVFGCRMERRLVYQMPGRLVGMTTTETEPYRRGYVLTLSPREQHIRREKATSNICSNQALLAVRAAVYLSTLGADGIRELAERIAYSSRYATQRLGELDSVTAPALGPHIWKEFVVKFDGISARNVHESLLEEGLHGGQILSESFPELGESMLFCVTELHDKESIDRLTEALGDAVRNGGVV
ncbi:aminomethyl-transferring glycine dehydrogenase subunit GcvPA [Candidatus Thorarchaeota archaeon]|nr:MAG: aminomethyl-transferring glycine dehydrogenase subunit GcvPA [Candidatus Thorarchaeota archaeon]